MHETLATAKAELPKGRPFPWRCARCRQKEVRPTIITHQSQVLHDGVLHLVSVPNLKVPQCGNCGELAFTNDADDQISEALRAMLGMLSPQQIQSNREALGWTEAVLAGAIGVQPKDVSDWENGLRIHSKMADRFLRMVFYLPELRLALAGLGLCPDLGDRAVPDPTDKADAQTPDQRAFML